MYIYYITAHIPITNIGIKEQYYQHPRGPSQHSQSLPCGDSSAALFLDSILKASDPQILGLPQF